MGFFKRGDAKYKPQLHKAERQVSFLSDPNDKFQPKTKTKSLKKKFRAKKVKRQFKKIYILMINHLLWTTE